MRECTDTGIVIYHRSVVHYHSERQFCARRYHGLGCYKTPRSNQRMRRNTGLRVLYRYRPIRPQGRPFTFARGIVTDRYVQGAAIVSQTGWRVQRYIGQKFTVAAQRITIGRQHTLPLARSQCRISDNTTVTASPKHQKAGSNQLNGRQIGRRVVSRH
jgi:hypothetical protein